MSENVYTGEQEKIVLRRLTGKDFRFFVEHFNPKSEGYDAAFIYDPKTLAKFIERIEQGDTKISGEAVLDYLDNVLGMKDYGLFSLWLMEIVTSGLPQATAKNSGSSSGSRKTKKDGDTTFVKSAEA